MNPNAVFIIAEAGVNHNGSVEMALRLVDAALSVGADAVKFQTFRAEDVVVPNARTADYQRANTGSDNQFDMIRALELDEAAHRTIASHCEDVGIEFFSTPFSETAVDMLVGLGVKRIKLPSGEITNRPLLEHAAKTGLPLLLSSGMATLEEVRAAVRWIADARVSADLPPPDAGNLWLLHCTSAYPAPDESLNLRALTTMVEAFGLPVGYSDHSVGIVAALAAVAMGARTIEKHLTLDNQLPGPDQAASAEPQVFAAMVKAIRQVERMHGDGIKRPHPVESNTRDVARRSIVLTRHMRKGEVIAATDVGLRRPGTGLPPDRLDAVIGMQLAQDVEMNGILSGDDLVALT